MLSLLPGKISLGIMVVLALMIPTAYGVGYSKGKKDADQSARIESLSQTIAELDRQRKAAEEIRVELEQLRNEDSKRLVSMESAYEAYREAIESMEPIEIPEQPDIEAIKDDIVTDVSAELKKLGRCSVTNADIEWMRGFAEKYWPPAPVRPPERPRLHEGTVPPR